MVTAHTWRSEYGVTYYRLDEALGGARGPAEWSTEHRINVGCGDHLAYLCRGCGVCMGCYPCGCLCPDRQPGSSGGDGWVVRRDASLGTACTTAPASMSCPACQAAPGTPHSIYCLDPDAAERRELESAAAVREAYLQRASELGRWEWA